MKPTQHIIVSFSVSVAVCFLLKSLYTGLISFISALLLDIDHIIEYINNFGWRDFTFRKCYQASVETAKQGGELRFKKLHLVFHSLELACLLWLLTFYTKNIYLFAATLGYSTHLALDYLAWQTLSPYFYSITWRAMNGFQTDKLIRKN